MSTFQAAFRELVVPDLRRACRHQALSVARDRCGFTDANIAVYRMATARGATHLPDGILLDLEVWIQTVILKTVVDIENRPEAAREIVDEILEATWRATT